MVVFSHEDLNPDQRVHVGRDYYRELPEGYKLISCVGDKKAISGADDLIIVGPVISEYSHSGGFIFGRVAGSEELGPERIGVIGHFIINTKNGEITQGMNKDKWLQEPQNKKVTDQFPEMRSPGR